jgi:hypothetical protein
MNMEYLAVALLSCLVGACGMNQKHEAIQGDMPFVLLHVFDSFHMHQLNKIIMLLPSIPYS